MNNTLLFIVVAIIILAVVALLFLKKLQNTQGRLPRPRSIDQSPAIKVADPRSLSDQDIANTLAKQASAQDTPTNDLAVAERYVSNQDYPSAINELKRLLMTNPRHSQAMLKLLQVYGLTGQHTAFNQLHQKICEIADEKTIQEANFCKALIDEEVAQMQATPAPAPVAPTPIQIDTIEYEKPSPKVAPAPMQVTPAVAESNDEVFELDFDIDDTPTLTTPAPTLSNDAPITKQTSPSLPQSSDDDALLELEALMADSTPNNPTIDSKATTEPKANIASDELDMLEFDFNFDNNAPNALTPNLEPTQTQAPSPATDERMTLPTQSLTEAQQTDDFAGFDFDFEPSRLDTDTKESSLNLTDTKDALDFHLDDKMPAPTATDSTPVGEFDLSELSLNTQAKTKDAPTSAHNIGDDGIDFDFDFSPALDSQDTLTAPSAHTQRPDDALSFDLTADTLKADEPQDDSPSFDFVIDEPSVAHTTDTTTASSLAPHTHDILADVTASKIEPEFGFEIEPPAHHTTPKDSAFDEIAFELAPDNTDTAPTQTDAIKTKDAFMPSMDFDWQSDLEPILEAPAHTDTPQEIPVVITPTPAVSLEERLNNPSDDDIAITLALAKQYVEFGEYDGAKRLLQEVVQAGTTTQKQEAHSIMVALA